MVTLRNIVEAELSAQPDLLYWLGEGLINVNSLARHLRSTVEKQYGSMVGLETISMTIRRILKDDHMSLQKSIRIPQAKNIQVQLDVSILTFKKGISLGAINRNNEYRFFSFAQGQTESMLAISKEDQNKFNQNVAREQTGMAALTVTLNNETSETVGAYGYILLLLALAGIPLAEVVTLHDDITLLIADEHVDRAFQILRQALKSPE